MSESGEIIIGEMKVAENVLVKMIRESAAAVEGVSQIREVSVEPKENVLVADINIIVGHETVYPDVAQEVQKAVATDVNRMTGVNVAEVNVMVERLDFKQGAGPA